MNQKVLWYDKPAAIWNEALPIGNGRIGAMVYSGDISDRIQINEETLWSGYPNRETRQHSMTDITEIRQLVKEKLYLEAYNKANEMLLGVRSDGYVPYGSLFLDIIAEKHDVTNYRRELLLKEGIIRTSYQLNGGSIEKETFISQKDDVLVLHIKSEKKLNLHIYQAVDLENSIKASDSILTAQGKCPAFVSVFTVDNDDTKETVHFCSRIKVISEEPAHAFGNGIWIRNTHEATVLFSIKTSFNGFDKMPVSEGREYVEASLKTLEVAKIYTYEELKKRHITEYQKFFDRVELEIAGEDYSQLPTDKRIQNVASGVVDNQLVVLLFDYGRYLLIASSANGTQPANLQGIWNQHLMQRWSCNYTININTEMNYWAAETINLPECHIPLMKMIKELSQKGNNFGLRGWACGHNSDIWRFNHMTVKNAKYGYWAMGGFWLVRHIWEHYLHTLDVEFLREYYPVMTSAAEFLMDWMYKNEEGQWTTCPSISPENLFAYNGKTCAVCEGSAMDMSIIYDLFDKLIKVSKILGEEALIYDEILADLKPVLLGQDGRILEWGEEFEESEKGHRHISHLYGFFPGDVLDDEHYADAVRETLRVRLENGGGHTGWSNAWIANVYARLGDGEMVMHYIRNMFKSLMFPNMFDACPPFQIDGNFGILSAICEALMQSHRGKVELLPALPKEWKSGYIKGFVARTGEKVNFRWEDGKIMHIS